MELAVTKVFLEKSLRGAGCVVCVCALVDRKQLQAALALACVGGIFALRILYFLNLFEKVVKRLLSCQT